MAKKKAEKIRKKRKDQADTERARRVSPPAKVRPQTYRFDDWASI